MRNFRLLVLIGFCFSFGKFAMGMDGWDKSSIGYFANAGTQKYDELVCDAERDKTQLFVQHLEKRHRSDWPGLLSLSLENGKMTAQDILYVIKNTDLSKPKLDGNSKSLFELILARLQHKDEEKRSEIIKLLVELRIDIPKTWRTYAAQMSVLLGCLEENPQALKEILDSWPKDMINPLEYEAIIIQAKDDEAQHYKLESYILRDEAYHMSSYWTRDRYARVAQILYDFCKKRMFINNETKVLARLLKIEELVPAEPLPGLVDTKEAVIASVEVPLLAPGEAKETIAALPQAPLDTDKDIAAEDEELQHALDDTVSLLNPSWAP